jgi:AAA+ ATPase superfamily predicted ATPase
MKFYDREREIGALKNINGKARIAVLGRRRVGKTTLVETFYGDRAITLFIPAEKTEKAIITDWVREYPDLTLPSVDNFRQFFEHLFVHHKDRCIFIDEIQNVTKVNPSFLFDLQRLIDKQKPDLVITGSLISSMKGIVEEYRSPLYGRFDLILKLRELDLKATSMMCRDLGLSFKDALKLYMIFGGIPKYFELIEKMKRFDLEEFIIDSFIRYPRPLFEEVRTQLREEFGSEFKTYFTILYAISQGSTRQMEIASFVGRKDTSLTKYLSSLREDFELIQREMPVTRGRGGSYAIKNNIVSFWFSNVWRHLDLLESGQEAMAQEEFLKGLDPYLSRRFEITAREFIPLICPFDPLMTGRQWGRIKGASKDKNQYEIDIVAYNPKTKEILFAECKWQDKVDAPRVLAKLKEKARYVDWNIGDRKEYYAVFARSFSRLAHGSSNIDLKAMGSLMIDA